MDYDDRYSSSSEFSFNSTLNEETDFDRLFQNNTQELKNKRILQEHSIFLEGMGQELATSKVKV